jgi:hypothetical protein
VPKMGGRLELYGARILEFETHKGTGSVISSGGSSMVTSRDSCVVWGKMYHVSLELEHKPTLLHAHPWHRHVPNFVR